MKIMNVFRTLCPTSQKASVDEAYLDLTESVDQRLAKLQEEATQQCATAGMQVAATTAHALLRLIQRSHSHAQLFIIFDDCSIIDEYCTQCPESAPAAEVQVGGRGAGRGVRACHRG